MLRKVLATKNAKIAAVAQEEKAQKRVALRFDVINGKVVYNPNGQYHYDELNAVDRMYAKVAYKNYQNAFTQVDERTAIRQFNHGN